MDFRSAIIRDPGGSHGGGHPHPHEQHEAAIATKTAPAGRDEMRVSDHEEFGGIPSIVNVKTLAPSDSALHAAAPNAAVATAAQPPPSFAATMQDDGRARERRKPKPKQAHRKHHHNTLGIVLDDSLLDLRGFDSPSSSSSDSLSSSSSSTSSSADATSISSISSYRSLCAPSSEPSSRNRTDSLRGTMNALPSKDMHYLNSACGTYASQEYHELHGVYGGIYHPSKEEDDIVVVENADKEGNGSSAAKHLQRAADDKADHDGCCWRWKIACLPNLSEDLLPSLAPCALSIPPTLTPATVLNRICTFCKVHSMTCLAASTSGRLDAYTHCGKLKLRLQLWKWSEPTWEGCIANRCFVGTESGEISRSPANADAGRHNLGAGNSTQLEATQCNANGANRTVMLLELQRRQGCCIVMKMFRKDLYHAILTGENLTVKPQLEGDEMRSNSNPCRFFSVPDSIRKQFSISAMSQQGSSAGIKPQYSCGSLSKLPTHAHPRPPQKSPLHHARRQHAGGTVVKRDGHAEKDSGETVGTYTSVTSASGSSYNNTTVGTSTNANLSADVNVRSIRSAATGGVTLSVATGSSLHRPNHSQRLDGDVGLGGAADDMRNEASDDVQPTTSSSANEFSACLMKCLELLESEHVDQNHLGMEFLSSCTIPESPAQDAEAASPLSPDLTTLPQQSQQHEQQHQKCDAMPQQIAKMLLNKPSDGEQVDALATRLQLAVFAFLSINDDIDDALRPTMMSTPSKTRGGHSSSSNNSSGSGNNKNDRVPGQCFSGIVPRTASSGSLDGLWGGPSHQNLDRSSDPTLSDHKSLDESLGDDANCCSFNPGKRGLACHGLLEATQVLAWIVLTNCLCILGTSCGSGFAGNSCPSSVPAQGKDGLVGRSSIHGDTGYSCATSNDVDNKNTGSGSGDNSNGNSDGGLNEQGDATLSTDKILVDDSQQRELWGCVLHAMLRSIQHANQRPRTAALAIQSLRWMARICPESMNPMIQDETIHVALLLPAYEYGKTHHAELEEQASKLLAEIKKD